MEVPIIVKLNQQKELKGKKTEKDCWKMKCTEPNTKKNKNSCWKN